MTRVHVYGASGYAGLEAVRLILAHPELELGVAESASHAGDDLEHHSALLYGCGRVFDGPGGVAAAISSGDCVIAAGAHGTARAAVPAFLAAGARVVDLSADYRLEDGVVYGYAHLFRNRIAGAGLIANPGCYPTATLLATLPLAPFAPSVIVVDAKSGVTGAGKTPNVSTLFAEVAGEVRAYGLDGHRHEAEIERYWCDGGIDASLHFTPHVVPVARGMLVNASAILTHPPSAGELVRAFEAYYDADPFVRIVQRSPVLAALTGTNGAQLHVSLKGNVARVLCAIDNLGRGAAAQAISNVNIMYGYPEALGLANAPIPA